MLVRWNDINRSFGFPSYQVRTRPFAGFPSFNQIFRLLEDVGEELPGQSWLRSDLYDAGEELVFTADVPGLTSEEIDVSIHEGVLTVTAERNSEPEEGRTEHRRERFLGKATRSITLPTEIDLENVSAKTENGVLTVTLPKAPEVKPRKIEVKAA